MHPLLAHACLSRRTLLRLGMAALARPRSAAAAGSALPGLVAGTSTPLRVGIPAALHRLCGDVRHAEVSVVTPARFDATKAWPVLIVNATSDPGHQSSRELLAAYGPAAASADWVSLAADPERTVAQADDTLSLRYALAATALAAVRPLWHDAGQSPVAFAGFSGGAKYAGWLAALFASQGAHVAGIFLSGVNEAPLASAARQFGVLNDRFRAVPVFLQSGQSDSVATPDRHREIADSLRRQGFRAVRLAAVEGGHQVDASQLPAAMAWFTESDTRPR